MNGLSLAEGQTWGRWHGGFRIHFQHMGPQGTWNSVFLPRVIEESFKTS